MKKQGKVGIITLNGYGNYGQKFQNYAVKKIFENLGYDSQTLIINESKKEKKRNELKKLMYDLTLYDRWKRIFRRLKSKIKGKFNEKNYDQNITVKKFKDFCKKNINEKIVNQEDLKNIEKEFDFFSVGSDQVWSYRNCRPDYNMFLRFAPKNKRLAIAPSIGTKKIPFYKKRIFSEYMKGFNNLSVREYDGSKIIKKLSGKDAKVLLDPTFSISKNEWLKISKKVKNKPKEYILVYVLWSGPESMKKIKQISKKYNLPIVSICNLGDFKKYDVCPSEFIDLINNAKLVITDSYHGTIFSMLFSKPFVIIKTMINDSRFNSLNKYFGIRGRFEDKIKDEHLFSKLKNVSSKIQKLKKETYGFVKKSIKENVSESKK